MNIWKLFTSFEFNFGLVNLISVLTGLTFIVRGPMPKSVIMLVACSYWQTMSFQYKMCFFYKTKTKTISFTVILSVFLSEYTCLNFQWQGSQTLTAEVWQAIQWKDPRLRWSPRNYFGVQSLSIPAESLWTPDIVLYNKWVFVLSIAYNFQLSDFFDRIYSIEREIKDTQIQLGLLHILTYTTILTMRAG